jgi:hypothetical protein
MTQASLMASRIRPGRAGGRLPLVRKFKKRGEFFHGLTGKVSFLVQTRYKYLGTLKERQYLQQLSKSSKITEPKSKHISQLPLHLNKD